MAWRSNYSAVAVDADSWTTPSDRPGPIFPKGCIVPHLASFGYPGMRMFPEQCEVLELSHCPGSLKLRRWHALLVLSPKLAPLL
jgi:hypothetical protein